jgi:hypothetical protein
MSGGGGVTVGVPSAGFSPATILARLITVDGTGSGLDADLLDGQHGSYYRDATNINAGLLAVAYGGTGLASYAVGDIIYASGATTLSKLADVATGNALISGGVTTAPSWGKIDLTTHVSGTLTIANGGTNSASALSGSSIMVSNGTSVIQGSAGTTTTVLHGNAAGVPTYGAVSLTADVSGILPSANGGTGVNNAGTITNASNTTITGGGTIALGGFTLTVPATGTVGLIGTTQTWALAQTFTAAPIMSALTASRLVRTDGSKALESNAALTSTRVIFADGSGWPTDSANFTFSGTLLTLGTGATGGLSIAATTGTTLTVSSTSTSTTPASNAIYTAGGIGAAGSLSTAGSANRLTAGTVAASGTLLQATKTITSTTGQDFGVNVVVTVQNATSKASGNNGLAGNVTLDPSGATTTGQTAGVLATTDANGPVGATHALVVGIQGAVRVGGLNTVTTAHCIDATMTGSAAGAVGTLRGFYLSLAGGGGVTATTAHGIYLENVSLATTNYAIYTNSGLVRIGDTTEASAVGTAAETVAGGLGVAKRSFLGTIGSTFKGNVLAGVQDATADTAGAVGEVTQGTNQTTYTNFTTTNTYQQLAVLTSLAPGRYRIVATATYYGNAATVAALSEATFAISTTTASAAGAVEGRSLGYIVQQITSSLHQTITLDTDINISAATSYYFNGKANFTVGNPQWVASITAYRLR